jgi:hypothetical protein
MLNQGVYTCTTSAPGRDKGNYLPAWIEKNEDLSTDWNIGIYYHMHVYCLMIT